VSYRRLREIRINIYYTRLRTTTQCLIVLETDRPLTIPTARGQTWQGRASCSGLFKLVRSSKPLACLQLYSGSPVERWWRPCSYGLAAHWQRPCLQWAPRRSAGVYWVVGHSMTHPALKTSSAGSSGCSRSDRLSWHLYRMSNRRATWRHLSSFQLCSFAV